MKHLFLTSLLSLAACGGSVHRLPAMKTVKPSNSTPTSPKKPATVIDSVSVPVALTVHADGSYSMEESFSLVTVPASTAITVYSYLNSSAGSSLGVEEFGYFNVKVKNNSSAVWNKTAIYLGVRFSVIGNTFQSPDATLVTSIIKPAIGAEAEAVTAIPTGLAGTGVNAYSICNATVGACAAKPSYNNTFYGIYISGDFKVPAGSYSGTVTFELLAN